MKWEDDEDPRAPRKFGWGCALAAIIGSAAAVIAFVILARTLAEVFTP